MCCAAMPGLDLTLSCSALEASNAQDGGLALTPLKPSEIAGVRWEDTVLRCEGGKKRTVTFAAADKPLSHHSSFATGL